MITRRYCIHATGHEIRIKIESLLAGEGIEVKAIKNQKKKKKERLKRVWVKEDLLQKIGKLGLTNEAKNISQNCR